VPQIKTIDSLPRIDVFRSDTTSAPSLFQQHELQVNEIKPVIHYTHYDYLAALILFIAFSLFVWLYVSNYKKLNQLIRDFYRSNKRSGKDDYAVSNRVGFTLSVLFLIVISLFISQLIDYYGFTIPGGKVGSLGIIASFLAAMYLIKIAVLRISGFIFKTHKEVSEYISVMFVFLNILGLFMLPVVICLVFIKQLDIKIFIYTGYFIIGSFLCLRLLKGLVIGFGSNRVSKFYLFLYLCTLEIVPFIILIKLFRLYID
jgi:hypothetical protein